MIKKLFSLFLGFLLLLHPLGLADEFISGFTNDGQEQSLEEESSVTLLNESIRSIRKTADETDAEIVVIETDVATNTADIAILQLRPYVVQQVHTMPGSQVYAAAPVAVPIDNSKPQKTEGFEILSLAVTPKDATNILEVEVVGCFDCNAGARWWVMSLFKGTESDALATSWTHMQENAIDYGPPLPIRYQMVAGTTSEITFKVRAGTDTGSRMASNGIDAAGGRLFGGTSASSITITEYNFS